MQRVTRGAALFQHHQDLGHNLDRRNPGINRDRNLTVSSSCLRLVRHN